MTKRPARRAILLTPTISTCSIPVGILQTKTFATVYTIILIIQEQRIGAQKQTGLKFPKHKITGFLISFDRGQCCLTDLLPRHGRGRHGVHLRRVDSPSSNQPTQTIYAVQGHLKNMFVPTTYRYLIHTNEIITTGKYCCCFFCILTNIPSTDLQTCFIM